MDKIYFTVNGDKYTLSGSDVSPSTTLNDFLRNRVGLQGTKAMCHEGGCGACIVSAARVHPATKERHVFAVNSCLVHILSCHQWDITTIEGVGNRKDGYSPIQTRLASFNGTQCGYCTPGWIMNMHCLQQSSDRLTMRDIERSFGGNMCRCTGYRPILDAFKSFANDTDVYDVEDLYKMKCITKRMDQCGLEKDWCVINNAGGALTCMDVGPSRWYKAYSVKDVFRVLSKEGADSYRLVAGNTGRGVYPIDKEARVQIDISSIESLKDYLKDENLVLGAGMTLTDVMQVFQKKSRSDQDFQYLDLFYQHLELVAHVPVRNIGTIGGNLALKNANNDFPSDIFVLLETVQAIATLVDKNLVKSELKMQELMKADLKNKLILNVKLPPLSPNNYIRTYKIMPRSQNAHAIVNAGFSFHLDASKKIISSHLVYGGISATFVRAKRTEASLQGLNLFDEGTLKTALRRLEEELTPDEDGPEPSAGCRKAIALGLFYKALLSMSADVNPRYRSGGEVFQRPVSRASQAFDTDKAVWPLGQPVPKLEALTQCSGEVQYACDVPNEPRGVHAALVLSTICIGDIVAIDSTEALKIPGVLAVLTAKDIPKKNCFTPTDVPWMSVEEEILASKRISYYGQPVAIVAAVTRKLALDAVDSVKVTYNKSKAKPVLTVEEALLAPDKEKRIREDVTIKPSTRGTDIIHTISGSYAVPGQYHYSMETQCCTVRCGDVLEVRSSTQWVDLVHVAVASMLGIPLNKVEVTVPRVGGAYGGKASRSALVACGAALVAQALARPATLALPLGDNMHAVGKRSPCYCTYDLGVNAEGVIQYLNITYYSDCGCSYNDTPAGDIAGALTNLYGAATWALRGYSVLTDTASNTWCRAPATTEATAIIEHIMERISHVANKDPIQVRLLNIAAKHNGIKDMIAAFKIESNYDERQVQIALYNAQNAWTKKSLRLSLMSYPITYLDGNFPVSISVYHGDGTVRMSHGGIEMGQGINTKAAQVCAYILNIPLDTVSVKGTDSFTSPNAMASNGSVTSECVAHATVKACKELLGRLEPVRQELYEPSWLDVVKKAYDKGISLHTSAMMSPLDNLEGYDVYGVCASEVVLDVVTGCHQVTRVDLIEDTGRSLNPDLDVGQIEGAFVMGLGLWTCERLVFSDEGRLLSDRTWTYKVPGALDIPLDFRVSFQRNSTNNAGVLRSKATGEPALVLAVVVTHALYQTILEARKEYGYDDVDWVHVDTPYSVENILKAISPKIESYKIH